MPMTIATKSRGDPPVCVVALAGELDASNFEQLIATAREAYDHGAVGLALDLGELTFMASSGLVALYAAERIFRGEAAPDLESGWQVIHDMADAPAVATNVRLVGTQGPVRRVLDRTGLGRLFATDDSIDDAVAAIRGG